MPLSAVAAMGRNRVIGAGGRLPWRMPADLRRFKALTVGKLVVMGRRTYESIGKPLADRRNVVLTRRRGYEAPGCMVVSSLEAALALAGPDEEVMIAGGAEVYREALPRCGRIYLTLVEADFAGDASFPALEPGAWVTCAEESFPADERNPYPYRFLTLLRRQACP